MSVKSLKVLLILLLVENVKTVYGRTGQKRSSAFSLGELK